MLLSRLMYGVALMIAVFMAHTPFVNAGGAERAERVAARQSQGFSNVSIYGDVLSWDPIAGTDSYEVFLSSGRAQLAITVWDNRVWLQGEEMCTAGESRVWDVTLRAFAGRQLLVEEAGYRITCASS